MNKTVEDLVQQHLAIYPEQTPLDRASYLAYLGTLYTMYTERCISAAFHIAFMLWFIFNISAEFIDKWSIWTPLIAMIGAAISFRVMIRE